MRRAVRGRNRGHNEKKDEEKEKQFTNPAWHPTRGRNEQEI